MHRPRRLAPALISAGAFFSPFTVMPAGVAQSALVSTSTNESRGFQASNSSGFSFSSNGTLAYEGALNELRPLPMGPGATLQYDNRTISVTPSDALIQTRMPEPAGLANTLSGELATSTIPASGSPQEVQLGYALVIPAITGVSGSNSTIRFEQVDSQSLSIFPRFSPSVFR